MAPKTARRDAVAGALYQDSRGLLTAAVTLPPGADGKRHPKIVHARTKAAASDELTKAAVRTRPDRGPADPLPHAQAVVWLKTKSREMKPNSLAAYSGPVDRDILPTLGRYRLDKLTAEHVRRLHTVMLDKRGLTPTTAANTHAILFETLMDALNAASSTPRKTPAPTWRRDTPLERLERQPTDDASSPRLSGNVRFVRVPRTALSRITKER